MTIFFPIWTPVFTVFWSKLVLEIWPWTECIVVRGVKWQFLQSLSPKGRPGFAENLTCWSDLLQLWQICWVCNVDNWVSKDSARLHLQRRTLPQSKSQAWLSGSSPLLRRIENVHSQIMQRPAMVSSPVAPSASHKACWSFLRLFLKKNSPWLLTYLSR